MTLITLISGEHVIPRTADSPPAGSGECGVWRVTEVNSHRSLSRSTFLLLYPHTTCLVCLVVHSIRAVDMIPRRPNPSVLPSMPHLRQALSTSIPPSKPLRPRPVSQLRAPQQSSHLRVAVSVESMLRQSGAAAKKHTLHQPYAIAAPGTLAALRYAVPAYVAGATALACAGLVYLTCASQGPLRADSRDACGAYTDRGRVRSLPLLAFFCTDQLQIVKDVAQVGPM